MKNDLNAPKTVTTDLEKMLSVAMLTPMDDPHDPTCRWGAPTICWGPPGIGKSGRIEEVGRRTGLSTGTVYLSSHQPEDISGVFMPNGLGGALTVCPLPQVNMLVAQGRGILFLDELSTAKQAMQNAGLGVIRERFWAGHRLPGGIRILAAANPVDTTSGAFFLTPPMANRLLHLHVGVPSIEDWSNWLLSGAPDPAQGMMASEATIAEKWVGVWAKVRGLAAGFMKHRRVASDGESSVLYALPPVGPERSGAWPSPRSWEVALRCIATAEILGEPDVGLDLLGASVGASYSALWSAYIAEAQLPDPEEILRNGWRPDPRRLDIAMAAYSSAISFVLGQKDKQRQREYAVLAWKLLQGPCLQYNMPDIALAPAAALMRAGYSYQAGGEIAQAAEEIIYRFGKSGLARFVPGKP